MDYIKRPDGTGYPVLKAEDFWDAVPGRGTINYWKLEKEKKAKEEKEEKERQAAAKALEVPKIPEPKTLGQTSGSAGKQQPYQTLEDFTPKTISYDQQSAYASPNPQASNTVAPYQGAPQSVGIQNKTNQYKGRQITNFYSTPISYSDTNRTQGSFKKNTNEIQWQYHPNPPLDSCYPSIGPYKPPKTAGQEKHADAPYLKWQEPMPFPDEFTKKALRAAPPDIQRKIAADYPEYAGFIEAENRNITLRRMEKQKEREAKAQKFKSSLDNIKNTALDFSVETANKILDARKKDLDAIYSKENNGYYNTYQLEDNASWSERNNFDAQMMEKYFMQQAGVNRLSESDPRYTEAFLNAYTQLEAYKRAEENYINAKSKVLAYTMPTEELLAKKEPFTPLELAVARQKIDNWTNTYSMNPDPKELTPEQKAEYFMLLYLESRVNHILPRTFMENASMGILGGAIDPSFWDEQSRQSAEQGDPYMAKASKALADGNRGVDHEKRDEQQDFVEKTVGEIFGGSIAPTSYLGLGSKKVAKYLRDLFGYVASNGELLKTAQIGINDKRIQRFIDDQIEGSGGLPEYLRDQIWEVIKSGLEEKLSDGIQEGIKALTKFI